MTERIGQRLEDELGCEGYYGFGAGYLWAKKGGPTKLHGEDREDYCSSLCARKELCWFRHRGRVMWLLPTLTATFLNICHQVRADDPNASYDEIVKRWIAEAGNMADPFTTVLTGNLEDGGSVANAGRVKPRGPFTIRWPFPTEDAS